MRSFRSFLVYVWSGNHSTAIVSTESEAFADKLKEWAESEGYRVEVKKDLGYGSHDK